MGSVEVSGLITYWSAPTRSYWRDTCTQSSALPTHSDPPSMAIFTSSWVGSGMTAGHSGMPSGLGKVSSHRYTRHW